MPHTGLIRAIINYFKEETDKPDVSPDTKESLEVAVQCLQTAYDIDSSKDAAENALPFSLEVMFDTALLSIDSDPELERDVLKKAEMMKILGNRLMKSGNYEGAIKYYTSAIEIDQNASAIFYGNRAAAYSKLNDFDNAISDCKMAIRIDPNYAKAYGRMGLAYASLNQHEEAINAFKKALELDPSNDSYKSNLKIAEEKKDQPAGNPTGGGLAGLSSVDWHTLFTNPAFRNMASTLIQDPNIISALSASMASSLNQGSSNANFGGGDSGGGAPVPNIGGGRNLDMLLEAGQYLAAQMQAANPDLVEQFRQTTSRTFNRENPDNTDSSTQ